MTDIRTEAWKGKQQKRKGKNRMMKQRDKRTKIIETEENEKKGERKRETCYVADQCVQ